MKLIELEPQFVRHELLNNKKTDIHVSSLDKASGIFFLCPICYIRNKGSIGTHGIIVTFADKNVPDELGSHNSDGKPSRWSVTGTAYEDLTLTPSIDISKNSPGEWHGYLTNGEITL